MTARLLKDPATASCRVFVGHLQTDDTNKMELEQHFSKYGMVIGSLMNRGFGFVQFENENSAVDAIQHENGQMFKGRRIDVRPAKKDPPVIGASYSTGDDRSKSMMGTFGGGSGGVGSGGGGSGGGGKNNQFMQRNSFGGGNQNMNMNMNQNQMQNQNQNPNFNLKNQDFNQRNQDFHPKNQDFNQMNQDFNPKNDFNNQMNQDFSPKNQDFNNLRNQDFNNQKNQDFGPNNENQGPQGPDTNFDDKPKSISPPKDQFNMENNQNQDTNDFQKFGGNNDSFNSNNQTMDSNDSFNSSCQSRGNGNNQYGGNSMNEGPPQNQQNRGGNNNQFSNNQNRPPNNANRNQNTSGGGPQSSQQGNMGHRPRGSRGGKNRNKNRDNSAGGNNFRDRSPINRGPRGNDDKGGRDWEHNMMPRGNNFGRDSFPDNNRFDDRFKDAMGMGNFGRGIPNDYVPPAPEKNDCEIIVVSKSLTEYAEAIEARLKKMGLTVDLLFPNEEVPLSRVLGNIANRGCLYAVVVTQTNMEHTSLTLNILHGLPQEHRNMPVDDALTLINRDFSNYKSGGRSVPFNAPFASDRHPDAIQVLLNMLADNHQLTVLQYDRVLKYLEIKRADQVQIELGDAKDLAPPSIAVSDPKQAELQSRILNILNSNKTTTNAPVPSPVPAPTPVPVPTNWGTAASTTATSTPSSSTVVTPSPLLNDPTVQKALDSLLQGNLLKSIGDPSPSPAPQPLFAAFPNINRF